MSSVLTRWNKKYAPDEFIFGKDPNDFLTTQASLFRKGAHILAAGDGEGRNGVWMAEQGFQVLSVDGAENGVLKANRRAFEVGVSDRFNALCVDLLEWVWPVDHFDCVVSLYLHFPPDERPLMHKAMFKALKPGGILILEAFHPDQVGRDCGGPKTPDLCFTVDQLKDDFSKADILLLEETPKEIKPTAFHDGGIGMVTRITVRKAGH